MREQTDGCCHDKAIRVPIGGASAGAELTAEKQWPRDFGPGM
jgi:hypothetical protein